MSLLAFLDARNLKPILILVQHLLPRVQEPYLHRSRYIHSVKQLLFRLVRIKTVD